MSFSFVKYIFSALVIFSATNASCQKPPEDGLQSDEVEVVKNFKANLVKAIKYNSRPILPDLIKEQISYNYLIPINTLKLDYPAPKIRPLAMKKPKSGKVYNFYGKAGFGWPFSPLAELSYHNGKSGDWDYGVNFNHHSIRGSRLHQRFGETSLKGHVVKYLDNGLAVGGNLGYTIDQVHFYGFDEADTTFTKEEVLQRFSTFDIGARFFNTLNNQSDFIYKTNIDFYTLSDKFGSSESVFSLKGEVVNYFDEQYPLKLALGVDVMSFRDIIRVNRALFWFNPSFTYGRGILKFKAGAYIGTDGTFYFAPDLLLSVNAWKEKVVIYAGWSGEIKKNTYRGLTDYNPFLNSTPTLINSRQQERFGGIKGSFEKINYDLRVAQLPITNLPLFLNDSSFNYQRFEVLYDTANVVRISGLMEVEVLKNLSIKGTLGYSIYNMKTQARAWHLPTFEANIGAKYQISPEFSLTGEFFTRAGSKYLDENREEKTLNALIDFNFGAHYQVSKNFGAFVQANNVINNKTSQFYLYPQYGFNIMGGITARF